MIVTLGLGSALLITLGLASSLVPPVPVLACIDDSSQTITMFEAAETVSISDEVPCP